MDTTETMVRSSDSIVAEALEAPAYVERFRVSDLGSGDTPDLLYAHRIASTAGASVGVLEGSSDGARLGMELTASASAVGARKGAALGRDGVGDGDSDG
jgi:hypothetical protein